MATLRDIAQQAEVSTATVSLALSGKGRISDEVRSKIVQIAHEIGYQYRKAPVEDHNCAVMLLPVYNTRGYVWYFLKDIIDHIQSSMTAGGYISLIIPILNDQPVSEIMEIILKTRPMPCSLCTMGTGSLPCLEGAAYPGSGCEQLRVSERVQFCMCR